MCAIHIGVKVCQRHTSGLQVPHGSSCVLYTAIVGLGQEEDRRTIGTYWNQGELKECTHQSTNVIPFMAGGATSTPVAPLTSN
jgi:hypothetical protein